MNIHLKKISLWLITILMLIPPSVSLAEDSAEQAMQLGANPVSDNMVFRDVGNHWAANAIYNMTQYGIINGYDDFTFKPGNNITREEFAALLAKSFSLEWNNGKQGSSYSDIQPNRWSSFYIEALKGIFPSPVSEAAQAEFLPLTPVTREEFAATLVHVLGYASQKLTDPSVLGSTFRDADQITENYRSSIAIAVELKLIQGQSNRMFAPKSSISRAEVASIMYRAIQLSEQEDPEAALQINLPAHTSSDIFDISGTVGVGSDVLLNGRRLEVKAGTFQAKLQVVEEGTYNIIMVVHGPESKMQFIRKKLVYERTAPTISLYNTSATTTKNTVELSGKVAYEGAKALPDLYINDEKISLLWTGEFNKQINMEDGNNFVHLKVIGSDGRTTELNKEILFTPPPPMLSINQISSSTKSKTLTVTGSVKDDNDDEVEVQVDGQMVEVDNRGAFIIQLDLSPGDNTIVIRAENKYFRVSTIVKTIELLENK